MLKPVKLIAADLQSHKKSRFHQECGFFVFN